MATELRVGIVDSGYAPRQAAWVHSARRFRLDGEALVEEEAQADALGHGTAVLDTLAGAAPRAPFCVAQVFAERWQTSPLQIAAAVHWLIEQRVALINLSLGVRSDRPVLRDACAAARDAGILLCASSPAQGEPVFPASYPEVLRITGDARCAPGQWSWLNSAQADFGAPVAAVQGVVGASIACAALSALIVDFLQREPGADLAVVQAWLRAGAAFVGPERRGPAHA
ncbi:peptidase S8 and S53 subtilisin kexin sedolisin [Pseudomonas sp. UL073]|uniref:Peptidase S8 and S53 subtilisin kexin sedolisin n=1 Tax=Zestomonas insulae TaxID=2809017 RepID=A0ABS2IGA5_9GAMM|nr:S8 family serine peptidase [Pseudomonas insulae]MBM7061982.1 peptidase S8 and S53 subtilisin kexin sedolisin [Pseudomonas insulae]